MAKPCFVGLLPILLCFAWGPGSRAYAAPPGPLVFPKGDIELGVAKQHAQVVAKAEIRNIGATPVSKLRALSDCGCYSATLAKSALASSESCEVTVRFRTLSFSGALSKKLRIAYESSDGRQTATVRIKVSVVDGVVVRPGRLHFGQVDAGARPEGFVSVVWYEGVGSPFEIKDISVPNAKVKTTILPYADPKRPRWKGWEVRFKFEEPPPRGLFRREATLETTSKDQSRVTVPISAHVVGKVWIQTNHVVVGLVPVGAARAAHVLFRPAKAEIHFGAVRVTSAKGVLEPTVVKAPTRREPNMWRLTVSVPPGTPPGPLSDELLIHTGVPGEPPTVVRAVGRVYEP